MFLTCFFMDSFESRMNPQFLAESKKGMLWEPRVIESDREAMEGFKEDEKGKRRTSVLSSFSLSWFSVIHVFVVCVCIEFFGEVGHFTERSRFLELCVICEKLMVYRVVSYDIGERCSVQDEENGPEYWALRHTIHKLWWWRGRVIYWVWLTSVWELSLKLLECRGMNARNSLGGRGKKIGQYCQKLQKDPTKEEQKCHCPKRRECHLQYVTKRSRCCILIDRLTERGCWGCFLGDGRGVCGERLFQGFWTEMEGYKWDRSFSKDFCQVMAFSREIWRWQSSDHVVQCQW